MKKYLLELSYDGTDYSGWQIQKNATSIQTLVQEALSTILRHPVSITGSGRTDAGVHALAQMAHFSTPMELDTKKTLLSLNGLLPPTIRAFRLEEAPEQFHARYSAYLKIYRYHLHLSPIPDPFKRHYSLWIRYRLDLDLMQAAAQEFIGTRDFTSFSNEAHRGSASRDAVRTLTRLELHQEDGGVYFEFEADGFLYKMVRNIMGTLIDVGRGKLPLEKISPIFASKDRRRAAPAAPAHGLFLVKVLY